MDEWQQLDEAKRQYLEAKNKIETLRISIAMKICPLKIGDQIKVGDDGKEYEAVVEGIHYALADGELLDPIIGAPAGWSVHGHRIKKTDGTISSWSFGFSNFDAEFLNGCWVIKKRDLATILGI